VESASEAGGTFESENWISNETGVQSVIPRRQQLTKPGGVYIGVGPEQNFTYVAALRPKIAFIIDIRRQNTLQHLVYKVLFEISPDRAAFLSRLFSRTQPAGLTERSTVDAGGPLQPRGNALHVLDADCGDVGCIQRRPPATRDFRAFQVNDSTPRVSVVSVRGHHPAQLLEPYRRAQNRHDA
jgi:hypothetical protein